MSSGKVFIVIPNWNGKKFLTNCLASLRNLDYPDYRVVVVDNGSTDGSVGMLERDFPEAVVLANRQNEGFAAACNRGIRYGLEKDGDYILLLNNDTVVAQDFLSIMVKAMSEPDAGIVGPKIYYFDEPEKIWFAGGKFVWWRTSGKHLGWQQADRPEWSGERNCDFITGCAMLIRKEVFAAAGFLYEPYFLTVEDLDFCYQASKNGWKIKAALDAKIWHKVSLSRSGEFSFSNGYYGMRNRLFFAVKRTDNRLGAAIFLFAVMPLRLTQWLAAGKRQMAKGAVSGIRDFLRGKEGRFES